MRFAAISAQVSLGIRFWALAFLLASPAAGAQGLASVSSGSLKALAEVEAAVDRVASVLEEIKLSDLNVRYREGKFVEGNRSRAIKYVAVIRKQSAGYRRLQTLQGLFALTGALHKLERETEAMSSGLMRLASQLGGEAATKPLNWSLKLEQACDSLNKAFLAFDEEAFALLGRADDLLAKPLRPR